MSHFFFHERALNEIISLHSTKKDLTAPDISHMLHQLKLIDRNTRIHNVEKLLTIFFSIFQQQKSIESSNYAWEAILFLIHFLESDSKLKERGIIKEYIRNSKNLNSNNNPIYPKVLYQFLQFVRSLEESMIQSKPVGTV